ncbi:hypothetical protein ACFOTA_06925 [Chitinophaga sp. GCM10012297]|uniref:Uncharacterized protein n=1 Tax=Chitinophaga chungangae TaxID=2821488 RepID=A0ABS3YB87_9BACT|nr:hypothetical protein [Chitinophaga chungangae]MBO9151932.1 hypothetical protein [Chitinophaga chungangae]
MAQLPLVLFFEPAYNGKVRVIARPRRDLSTIAANIIFDPPHANPKRVSIYVPTPGTHLVTVYKTPDDATTGVQVISYDAQTNFYNGRFIPDLELEAGRNTAIDPTDPEVIVDPAAGSTEVAMPCMGVYQVARIFRVAAGRYMREDEYAITTSLGAPGLRLLKPDDVFYSSDLGGEILRIEWAPFYENNTGDAINDLNVLILDHVGNVSNPHSVTKAQVGLGNLPNATSNSYNENDANKLATAAALYALAQSINTASIIKADFAFIGNIGSVSGNSKVVNVVNSGGFDTKVTIRHNLNISVPHFIWAQIEGRGAQWNDDNDVFVTVGNSRSANEFDLFFRKMSPVTTNINCYYLIIRL